MISLNDNLTKYINNVTKNYSFSENLENEYSSWEVVEKFQ